MKNGHAKAAKAVKAAEPENTSPPKVWDNRGLVFGGCVCLAIIVWIVYGQTRQFDFVNFDDGQYITDNAAVTNGVSLTGVASAFNSHATDNWVPLTTISHMVDCQFYGLNAGGHHLTNILLHTAAVIFLFLALNRMTGALWRSAFVAAVFAAHPLRAESVAWISERKDVLCGLFFMLTLWAYSGYARKGKRMAWYVTTLFFAACALMSKPVAVTLPFVLLLLDYWPLKRFREQPMDAGSGHQAAEVTPVLRLIAEKIPFLILSVAACLPTVLSERQGITMTTVVPISLRMENALVSYVVYIKELFYPAKLAAFYYYPIRGLPFWEVAGAFLFLAAVSLAAFYWRRAHPYLLTGWFWYVVMLGPVIGLVQVGSQAHADRHTYFSEIGLGLLLTWLVADFCARLRQGRALLAGISAVILCALMVSGHRQTSYWRNGGTLWAHAIDCDPYDIRARYDLGNYLNQKKDLDGAIFQYESAIQVDPDFIGAHNNLGMALSAKGDVDGAIVQYEQAIKLDPDYAIAHYNLGSAILKKGQTDEAIQEFQAALNIDPAHAEVRNNPDLALPEQTAARMKTDYAQFHNGLGLALAWKGELNEAIVQYQEALKLNPYYLEAIYNLANAFSKAGQIDEAVAAFQEAFKMDPGNAKQHNNLGTALRRLGRTDEAIAQYQEALKMDPSYAPAYYNLGNVLFQKGEINEAIAEYQAALKAQPNNMMLQNNLAHAIWTLATSPDASKRNGTEAVEFAQTADQLAGGNNPVILRVLAASYAESGNFPKAIEISKRALALATGQQNSALVNVLQQEISRYQTGSAVRADSTDMSGW